MSLEKPAQYALKDRPEEVGTPGRNDLGDMGYKVFGTMTLNASKFGPSVTQSNAQQPFYLAQPDHQAPAADGDVMQNLLADNDEMNNFGVKHALSYSMTPRLKCSAVKSPIIMPQELFAPKKANSLLMEDLDDELVPCSSIGDVADLEELSAREERGNSFFIDGLGGLTSLERRGSMRHQESTLPPLFEHDNDETEGRLNVVGANQADDITAPFGQRGKSASLHVQHPV